MAAAQIRSTIVGVFEDRGHADQAVSDLIKAGFQAGPDWRRNATR